MLNSDSNFNSLFIPLLLSYIQTSLSFTLDKIVIYPNHRNKDDLKLV